MKHPPKKRPEEIMRDPLQELPMSQDDWSEFAHGVTLFNTGKFWHAHEAWEEVWKRHEEDERLFFQGLIQLAAAYHHLTVTRSGRGIARNLEKAYRKLEVFEPEYLGIKISPLLKAIEASTRKGAGASETTSESVHDIMAAKIQFQKPTSPDAEVEIQEAFRHPQFLEGVRLFNERYYWEAHEAFEEAWRDQEGDGKTILQAFVQMASGYNFLKMGKLSSARYLFEKGVEKFREFEEVNCPILLAPLAESLDHTLEAVGTNSTVSPVRKTVSPPTITYRQGKA